MILDNNYFLLLFNPYSNIQEISHIINEIAELIKGITKNIINNILDIQEHHFVSTIFPFFLILFHEKLIHKDSQQ